jgi:cysteine desulfurase/selenocysteine lyase
VDVATLDCDFYAFSGHKMFGPTGIGVLYGRASLLDAMPPYQSGGDMISSVTFARTRFNALPHKFEAGTPDISGAVALAAAVDYLDRIGWDAIVAHEDELMAYATRVLAEAPGVRLVGTAAKKAGVLSFIVDGVHPHDIGTALDRDGIAIRAGHHCCQPLMDRLAIPATARLSLALYNTQSEIDVLGRAIGSVRERFA